MPVERVLFGDHVVHFEPPDTVMISGRGKLDGASASAVMEAIVAWARPLPYALVLFDNSRVESLTPEARRVLATNGHRLPPRALAIYGSSFAVRVANQLMEKASWLLGSKNRLVHFADDEASARAWLAQMRERLARERLVREPLT